MTVITHDAPLRGKRIFITGGAGFIGSRLCVALAEQGATVTIYDNLLSQVHGPAPCIDLPAHLVKGDVRDRETMRGAIDSSDPQVVIHLAAETGTGQSADEPTRYTEVNVVGTAQLIEICRDRAIPPERFVLAGTRAVYGEGAYRDRAGKIAVPPPREPEAMRAGRFGVFDTNGDELIPVPTSTDAAPMPGSVYGSSKLMQEYLLAQTPAPWQSVILRLQNVYGPGQSLHNPYTGVLSIFTNQAMRGQQINIYEDGEIYRDFVFVDDVVAAFVAACHEPSLLSRTFNIGTGEPTSIIAAARLILRELALDGNTVRVNGAFRPGDIRYAVADIDPILKTGVWAPRIDPSEGIARLVKWARQEFEAALT
ncbi:conserved hypothetical protein [Altererythrobacter sp. B11]|uniref:NAD-dependent epimerase/dehydratase family protein n=1 Tax=Altererythrobacter sp. B11 TaxID=2060312 RepID=UPI000DC6DC3A|nr:NAD-dependent epimerase/dehydratase family protein [Altererythrobacter sp. B11]BBC71349.1 conserved hypothetical protein [Altererythrobacter sp. B11]